jgi:hypothetical protein
MECEKLGALVVFEYICSVASVSAARTKTSLTWMSDVNELGKGAAGSLQTFLCRLYVARLGRLRIGLLARYASFLKGMTRKDPAARAARLSEQALSL